MEGMRRRGGSSVVLLLMLLGLAGLSTAQELRDPLIGQVIDPTGEPVAGVMVEVWRAGGRGTGLLDLAYKKSYGRIAATRTDSRGRFAAQLPVGLPCRIVVDHPPFARFLREDCLLGLDQSIQLQKAAIVSGTIVAADGQPAKAKLRAWHRETHDEMFAGETDRQGRFRFDRVPPGPVRIDIDPVRAPSPRWHDTELVAGQTLRHDVKLERGVLLTGEVRDAATNKPIAGATIGEGWTFNRAVASDEQGRFELYGLGSRGYRELHCRAKGYVREVRKIASAAVEGGAERREVFLLTPGQSVVGRVVDEHGAPLTDVYVQVFGSLHDGHDQYHNCLATRTSDSGHFRLAGLRPDLNPVVVIRQDGRATKVFALPDAVRAVRKAGTMTLPLPRIVRGVLRSAEGEPLANHSVSIWGYNSDRHRLAPDGVLASGRKGSHLQGWKLLSMYVGRRETRTDALGRFAFGDLAGGSWHVVAYDEKNNRIAVGDPFVVLADQDPKPVELTVEQ
ncbi:MAG: hypothetical protein AB8H80_18735 [Planctomycetota bacterium]